MLTLDTKVAVPPEVLFAAVSDEGVLLDTRSNTYFALQEDGARLWGLLRAGTELRGAFEVLLAEFEVEPDRLESGPPGSGFAYSFV